MNYHAWQLFLEERGLARPVDVPPSVPDAGLCELDTASLISITGIEAERFLQGQVTGDVAALAGGAVQLTAHCSPKGRALANFLAWRRDDAILLMLPAALADLLVRRLKMFVLRSKVEVQRVDDGCLRLGLWGSAARAAVAALVGTPPAAPFTVTHRGAVSALRLPGIPERYALLITSDAEIDLAPLADPALTPTPAAIWRLLDIRAGLPWVQPETSEAFIPQMLNLDHLAAGISFTKGCFVGQEVIARLHHLGQVKRRCYPGRVASAEPPRPGTMLVSPASRSGQGAGMIVDAIASDAGGCELLAVVETAAAGGELRLVDAHGSLVELHDIPYPLGNGSAPRGT